MNPARPICGQTMSHGSRCGLKPGHRVTLAGPSSSACQDERYCCPRQHVGGFVIGCSSCNAEDIAALRKDVDDLMRQLFALSSGKGKIKVWATGLAQDLLAGSLAQVRRAESWLVFRLGRL